MMTEKQHGGTRPGAGRRPMTMEQIKAREAERRKIVVDELLFPALAQAFKCEPDQYGDRYLEVELGKMDIKLAYGQEGLDEWMSYFSVEKIGGRFADGSSHQTRWRVNLAKYGVILKFIESMGYDIKNLPDVWFPPEAMMKRVAAAIAKKDARKLKKLNKQWDELENK